MQRSMRSDEYLYMLIIRLLELWTKEVLSAFHEVIGNCKVKITSMTIMNMQDHQIVVAAES